MKNSYPEIQGGGSLILAWQIRNKRVLVVGGGEVSFPALWNLIKCVLLMIDQRAGRGRPHCQRPQCRRKNHRCRTARGPQ